MAGTIVKKVIIGGPGCGKTTRVLGIIEQALEDGIPPERIAYVSYTRAAVAEGKERASERFGLSKRRFMYFRTIHSVAYYVLGITPGQVLGDKDYDAIADACGEEFGGIAPTKGDRMLSVIQLARAKRITLRDAYDTTECDFEWPELEYLHRTIDVYKREYGKVDFSDMLDNYSESGADVDVDLLVVDEAQDLTPTQWAVVTRAFRNTPVQYFAGDDDQAIYQWGGSAVSLFQNAAPEVEVLPVSYRLPTAIWNLADHVSRRIRQRIQKEWSPTDRAGGVYWESDLDPRVLLERLRNDPGTALVLCRAHYMTGALGKSLKEWGIPYRTKDGSAVGKKLIKALKLLDSYLNDATHRDEEEELKEFCGGVLPPRQETRYKDWGILFAGCFPQNVIYYAQDIERNGFSPTKEPDIYLGTIHSVKGQEADHVYINLAITERIERGADADPDAELRVFYVGVTRAKKTLTIIDNASSYRFVGFDDAPPA